MTLHRILAAIVVVATVGILLELSALLILDGH